MVVTLGPALLDRYPRFSLYNSPYAAHDRGAAVDLYPETGDPDPGRGGVAPSPVAGDVLDVRTVDAPPKPYATDSDHLVLIDTGSHVVRVLHVDPAVSAGDRVEPGDSLGRLIRSGFFAPWVDDHIHLGFRNQGANHYRASGSLELDPGVDVAPVPWDGTGRVVATGETYAVLDGPAHPAPGECFAGLAADVAGTDRVLDGGVPHYDGGGALGADEEAGTFEGPVTFLGRRIGTGGGDGRTVAWDDVTVRANGDPITGLSLFCARDALAVKLVCPDRSFAVGDAVSVAVEPV
ncbi:hypothetical protein [Halorientalis halophila]|uniref:hypothetical protein n=1 Tax=Halorientalis halophila TaxID=3108499 RepID=UPI00300A30DE